MNTEQNSKALELLQDKAKELDEVASKFSGMLNAENFLGALQLGRAIRRLRTALDGDIMGEIMELMNTPLGFMTDRPNSKNPKKYSAEEVKDALIEAILRGYYVVGNEFNVIAGKFYAAKNGLKRKVYSYPGVTDFSEDIGVPKTGERGAVIKVSADWLKDGIKQKLSREIPVRINEAMGVDAILGKAQRKLYAAVLTKLSGKSTPEGEVEEPTPVNVTMAVKTDSAFSRPKRDQAPQETKKAPQAQPNGDPRDEPGPLGPLDKLRVAMAKDEITKEEILEVCQRCHADANSLEQIPEYFVTQLTDYWEDTLQNVMNIRKEAHNADH